MTHHFHWNYGQRFYLPLPFQPKILGQAPQLGFDRKGPPSDLPFTTEVTDLVDDVLVRDFPAHFPEAAKRCHDKGVSGQPDNGDDDVDPLHDVAGRDVRRRVLGEDSCDRRVGGFGRRRCGQIYVL